MKKIRGYNRILKALLKAETDDPDDGWREHGIYYGYPSCCIEDFIHRFNIAKFASEDQLKVSNHTGFIPCDEHTKQILRGELQLLDLIMNRECNTPFPTDGY